MVYIERDTHLERRRELERVLYQDIQELELLQESLSKTSILSERIETMLNSFDVRLGKLETSILPIHRSTQKLTKLYDHINSSLDQVQIVVDYFDIGTKEEPFIAKGPQEEDMAPFLKSVESLKDALTYLQKTKYKASDRAIIHLKYMLTKALGQLNNLFRKCLAAASTPHDPQANPDPPQIPEPTLKTLQKLSTELQTSSIGDLDFPPVYLKIYEEVRAQFLVRCLASLVATAREQEKVDRKAYQKGTCAFVPLVGWLLKLLKSEKDLVNKLLPKSSAPTIFQTTIAAPIDTVVEIGEAMCARVKRNVTKREYADVFLLVDVVEGLLGYLKEFEGVIAYAGAKGNDIVELAGNCKTVVVQALGQFCEDVKNDTNKGSVAADGTVHELTSTTLNTLRRLVDYHTAIDLIISDAAPPLTSQTFTSLLSTVLSALYTTIDQKSKSYKKPTLASIFLMNNYHYVCKNLRASRLADVAEHDDVERVEKLWGRQREVYRDSWKPVIEVITDKGLAIAPNTKTLTKSQKETIKDKFKSFNNEFDETYKQQKTYSIPDPELRAVVIKDVKAILLPFYRGFHDKFIGMEFTKNLDKYVRYSPKTLEVAIEKFFDTGAL
ncbi:hypothetical protein SpCBS45565_g05856 [Spizellomyces sp. 'palustris']|nr:hypothetical protein SpCBS45565_g05856 [Spizellomyces sp. 'palustris']